MNGLCKCGCGNLTTIAPRNRKRLGHIKGVPVSYLAGHGCKTHGHASNGVHTTEYGIWHSMIQRCTNSTSATWNYYGGRGITVCKRWRKFENFLKDMGNRPEGLSLDRRNNDKGYKPSNCRWATKLEQANNTRKTQRKTA